MFLMPSHFEPCGLNQLYSLRYGTVPVVRATGGLADTIVGYDEQTAASGQANGFSFQEYSSLAFSETLRQACDVYRKPEVWNRLIATGMKQDWSWNRSAKQYVELYKTTVARFRQGSAIERGALNSGVPAMYIIILAPSESGTREHQRTAMHEVALAFFWHQHQPYYPDDVAGENLMPWVRLHGTKDYWGMAMLLGETPELHATINLVPSLLTAAFGLYRGRPPGRAFADFAAAGRRAERSRHELPDGQFLHGPSGPHDSPVSSGTSIYIKNAAYRSTRPIMPGNVSTKKILSTCNAGRTWSGSTRWPLNWTPNWPNSARKAVIGRNRKRPGFWTSRWTC